VMTKSAAGLLPLLILAVYWMLAGARERPPLAKMLVALVMLGWIASVFPRMLLESSSHAFVAARQMLGL